MSKFTIVFKKNSGLVWYKSTAQVMKLFRDKESGNITLSRRVLHVTKKSHCQIALYMWIIAYSSLPSQLNLRKLKMNFDGEETSYIVTLTYRD